MKPGKHTGTSTLLLDKTNQCLWRGQQSVSLTPKAFLVLRYLMDRPGQLVTKEELLNAAWPEVYVGDATLKVCIRRLRQTLGDESREPRFIETVPWRGYRFIGTIEGSESQTVQNARSKVQGPKSKVQSLKSKVQSLKSKVPDTHPRSAIHNPHSTHSIGRESELAELHTLLDKTFAGEHQTIFLTGEPGIGKTTIIETFLTRIASDPQFWVISGQCIEHYGAGEAYLPVLEALERLCRLPGNESLISSLRQYAPMWLVQMPTLISAVEHKRLQRLLQGTTQERMMREFAELLAQLTMERPLVLAIEDLHWSDAATIDLLASLTRQSTPSRLFFIGTYRPDYITDSTHPLPHLLRELSTHRQSRTIALRFLDEGAIRAYLTHRFPASVFTTALARAVHQRTDGNPLFMVNVIEYLLAQGFLRQEHGQWQLRIELADVQTLIPTNVQQLIEMQIERLSPDEQHLLEVASVAGMEFTAAAVAAAIDLPIPEVEERYTKLARQFHFLRSLEASEWPDGTVAQQYGFIHSLYQNIFYQRTPAGKRVQLHCRIGQHEEYAYGEQVRQIAGELALHFERGRDFTRAVHYRRYAAEIALQRHAYQEAIEHLTIGLDLLKPLPPSDERVQQEISFCNALGTALTATQGYASVAVERTYSRAQALWQQAGGHSTPFPILLGLWGFAQVRADLQTALNISHRLLEAAQAVQNPLWQALAHNALGSTFFWQGNLLAARQHYEQSLTVHDPANLMSADFVDTPAVIASSSLAVISAHTGDFTQAQTYAHNAFALAQEHQQHYSLALAHCHIAVVPQVQRDFSATQTLAAAGLAFSSEKGFPYCLACSTIQLGWARAMQTTGREGIGQIHQGIAAYQATGAILWQTYFLALLAEAQLVAGLATECLNTVTEGLALAQARGQLLPQAWLHCIKGELILQKGVGGWGLGIGEEENLGQSVAGQRKSAGRGPRAAANAETPRSATDVQSPEAAGHRTPDTGRLQAPGLKPLIPNGAVEEAEGHFLRAIEIARSQHALSIQLRATLGVSRLWQRNGKATLARQLLAPLYEQFTNTHDTADLREAGEILNAKS